MEEFVRQDVDRQSPGASPQSRLDLLIETSKQVLAERTLEGLLQRVSDAARTVARARLAIAGHGYVNGRFIVGAASRAGDAPPCMTDESVSVGQGGLYALFIDHESVRLDDEQLRQHPLWRGLPPDHVPLAGLLAARLIDADGRPNGLIMVSGREEGSFDQRDESLLRQLAAIASLAVQHVEARDRAEQLRRGSENRLQAVVHHAPVILWAVDMRGIVTFLEGSGIHAAGYAPQRVVGRPVYEMFHDRPAVLERIGRAMIGETVAEEVEMPTGAIYAVRHSPVCDPRGQIVGVIGVGMDISDRKRAEEQQRDMNSLLERRAGQLRALAGELTRSEERERRRLATVLHDHLQQLLYAARLKTEMIRRRVQDETGPLFEEVEALLDQSIQESRSLAVELSPPVLYERGLAAALEWLARHVREKHRLSLELRLDAEAAPTDEETRILLFQAVRELVFNVVKHAAAPRATVEMTKERGNRVRITVSDEGAGFDASCVAGDPPGSGGFGLFSIRERLQLMGGRLEAESAHGRGTRMTISMPRSQENAAHAVHERRPTGPHGRTPAAAEAAGEEERPIRIVLADDHDVLRQGLAALLEEEADIQVVGLAADGEEAVKLAVELHPEIVLMDITMPRVDGIEATRRIAGSCPAIRVVGLSMHEERDMADAMRQAGACAYLSKGAPADVLVRVIRELRQPASN